MTVRETRNEDETIRYGEEFSRSLRPGDVVALRGDLGSGKTRFIKGICKGLGVTDHVASPTFTIVNEYHAGTLVIYHFDFYRIQSSVEIRDIGLEEYLSSTGAICLIEWADRAEGFLPPHRYDVHLRLGADTETRDIAIHHTLGAAA